MDEPFRLISGWELVWDIFGRWPSFHDAEVHSLLLDRRQGCATATMVIHTWRNTGKVLESGYYESMDHSLIHFHLENLTTLSLNSFYHQNVIFGLVVREVLIGELRCVSMTLEPIVGLHGEISAEKVSIVQVYPYVMETSQRPL
jgi:hypothetical protein